MTHDRHDDQGSAFDKNLRSLFEALAMFEREASVVLDRIGLDTEAVGRVMDALGSMSSEAVRPLAAALGIADAASVEALARDVRALLQGEARLRREQAQTAERFDDFLKAVEALGQTTAALADLQGRTQRRVEALESAAGPAAEAASRRDDLAGEMAALGTRIDEIEALLRNQFGAAIGADHEEAAAVRPARLATPRAVKAPPSGHKILEGLPPLEPKVRPA